jgi:hypothetical protein
MTGSKDLQRSLARFFIVVALLAQFAPSIHVLSPHEHDSSSCTHAQARIHLEASPSDGKEAPCFICTHLVNRQAPAITPAIICELSFSRGPKLAPLSTCPDKLTLEVPDNRGPPPTL